MRHERKRYRFKTPADPSKKERFSVTENARSNRDINIGRTITKMLPWGILLAIAYFLADSYLF